MQAEGAIIRRQQQAELIPRNQQPSRCPSRNQPRTVSSDLDSLRQHEATSFPETLTPFFLLRHKMLQSYSFTRPHNKPSTKPFLAASRSLSKIQQFSR